MKNMIFRIVSLFLLVLPLSLLSSCGGGGDSGSGTGASAGTGGAIPSQVGGSGNYGTLTFSGAGAAVTGTTFNARTKLFVANGSIVQTQWYNIDLSAGITYPYVIVIVGQDNGAVTFVTVVKIIDANNNAAGQWELLPMPTPSGTAATATNLTFTNVVVPGEAAASTTTSLTLNGTLNF